LAADAVLWSDGGGKAVAARRPIYGADRVARCMVGITRKRFSRPRPVRQRRIRVNGQPGNALIEPDGSIFSVLTVDVDDDKIHAVRIMRNPDKLRHVQFD